MPLNLSAYVVGRSSWGRLGLIVATAIGVHPGYRGIITLELRNIGEIPFLLRPGLRIAQMFFHTVEGQVESTGVASQYIGSVTPESSYIQPDIDLPLIDYIGSLTPSVESDVIPE